MTARTKIGWTARRQGREVWSGLVDAIRRVGAMIAVSQERRRLMELDDRALKDIGLTRGQATFEAMRPPWDVPDVPHRRPH